ncbi:prepilin-type N-terminal cleavage/methylation domain-containing protein [Campylobacter sp. MOP7]|uniref:prepilin-type N-terminal cleavage/methylation domain-containing protein n=1 Tax=Campylobacter canis TaxID=3378588 RepID=UPI00387EBC4B
MRRGFSLIELVVSIVVVGITLASVPTLFLQTSSNNNSAIIQESVMDAKTRMALILKSPWGCVDSKDENRTYTSTPIFKTPAITNNFYLINDISPDGRREYINKNSSTSCSDGIKTISDFKGMTKQETSAGYNRDSIVSVELITTIDTKDMAGNENEDIKKIEITATTKNIKSKNKEGYQIILRSYSVNIGDGPKIATSTW